MTFRREKISRLIIYISCIVLGCLIVGGISLYANRSPLSNISQESNYIPSYSENGILYSKYGVLNVLERCKKQNDGYRLLEIFAIRNNKAYFVYSAPFEESVCWEIGTIDLETDVFQTQCRLVNPGKEYVIKFNSTYSEKNGFYYNGKIILSDRKNVLEYDIGTNMYAKFDYKTYMFPAYHKYGKYIDRETVQLNVGKSSKIYTLEEMGENSNSIAQIISLKDKKTWLGDSCLYYFFSEDSIQVVDKKIYAVGQCLNCIGNYYAIILEYDIKQESWRYVTNFISGDIVHGNCYIVS